MTPPDDDPGLDESGAVNQIQVIARAAKILRALHAAPTGLALAQLATEVGLPRTTVHRIVQSLTTEGFVLTAPDDKIVRIGPELGRLASASPNEFATICHSFMEQLSTDVEETVDLAVLQGFNIRFVDHVPAQQRLRTGTVIGDVFPTYCTANGKALLATLPDEAIVAAFPEQLERRTPNTITDRDGLIRELDEARATGYAFDREEHMERICAVGTVIRDPAGARAALTIAAPSERFYGREDELAAALVATRDKIAAALGTPTGAAAVR